MKREEGSKYIVGIQTPNSHLHPGMPYSSLGDARAAVHLSLKRGYFTRDNEVHIVTGPGTIYQVVHKDSLSNEPELHKDGYILAVHLKTDEPQKGGVLQTHVGQIILSYPDEESLRSSVSTALDPITSHPRVLAHVDKAGTRTTYIHLHTGMLLMQMSTSEFLRQQNETLMAHMQAQGRTPSGVVLPGKA